MNILIISVNKYKLRKLHCFCFHMDYYDDILILKSPKLLQQIITDSHFSLKVDDIITGNSNNVKVLSSAKFDKKNKSTVNVEQKDSSKSKKSKNKLNKNKHRSDTQSANKIVHLEEDLFSSEIISRNGLKTRKSFLKNKKNKTKNQNLDIHRDNETLNDVSKDVLLDKVLSIKDLSTRIHVPEAEIITYLFLNKGISATINQALDCEICADIVEYYGLNVSKANLNKVDFQKHKEKYDFSSSSVERSPVITVLGHVDHGKTTLLDSILKLNLVNKESGGITQSMSGYEITYLYQNEKYKLIFLDTPGHESFKAIRLRGAKITDIVLLIIAMDDGLKEQTLEAIKYIKKMSLSCIVVITKSDTSSDNLDKIKDSLSKQDLLCEDWGGSTILVQVSALKGHNIDLLLSNICSLAKSKNLYANPQQAASGVIIDTLVDQKQGNITNLIVQNGTLKVGNVLVSDNLLGRVKSILDTYGNKVNLTGPSSVVRVLCFSSIPKAGSDFCCFDNEKEAKKHIAEYYHLIKPDLSFQFLNTRVSFDSKIPSKQLKLIIKADSQGSLEAIINLFSNISQQKVKINVIAASFGNITNNDIDLSVASESPILAFNVSLLPQIMILIKKYQINFKMFNIIYDLLDYVKSMMLDIVEPEYANVLVGNVVVQNVFKTNKGYVAGCIVSSGRININSYINVLRNNIKIYNGYIKSLKYTKNDVEEVLSPSECGLMSDFQDWQKSDLIEVYDVTLKDKVL